MSEENRKCIRNASIFVGNRIKPFSSPLKDLSTRFEILFSDLFGQFKTEFSFCFQVNYMLLILLRSL